MATRRSKIGLLVTVCAVSAMVIVGTQAQRNSASKERPSSNSPDISASARQGRESVPYGKVEWPAEVFIDLAPGAAGAPVTMIVSAFSKIPAASATLRLRIPPIADEPVATEVLWTGTPSGNMAETVQYVGDVLPEGKYKFVALLAFTADREGARTMTVSRSLYLDVRPTTILSSNVSFEHIKRVELWTELEKRVLMNLRPRLAGADPQTLARERELIEAGDPGIITRRIAELKATDPDVARRIAELNWTEVGPVAPAKVKRNVRGRPATEVPAPVRNGL
ncbi:MAG: hypothetical protein P8Z79_24710 [Sedimentisphaerales bacterium]|jgi:hypothetical protein